MWSRHSSQSGKYPVSDESLELVAEPKVADRLLELIGTVRQQ
jgi:hypothetical protein